jgi:hypothetical protein
MALFILVAAYVLASFIIFDKFRECLPHASFYFILLISIAWPLSLLYGYSKAVVGIYRGYSEQEDNRKP